MTVRQILHYPHPELRTVATEVTEFNDELKTLCEDLKETAAAYQAEGLAATQIGVHKRVFVIKVDEEYLVCVNPVILEQASEMTRSTEGCLSFPQLFDTINRSAECLVSYSEVDGLSINRTLQDAAAVAFQHELDHLDGKVFLDRMGKLQKHLATKKYNKLLKVFDRRNAELLKLLASQGNRVKVSAEGATK